jgi:hypothetical protein
MGEPVWLPVTTLVSLIQQESLGEPHPVLAGGERYVSHRFATVDVQVDDTVRDAVARVQRARVEYYGWITDGNRSYAVLVAGRGRAAVVLVREGDRVRIEQADPDRLVQELIHRLPEVPAGRGDSISVRAADYARGGTGGAVLRQATSSRSQQARRLDALLRAERTGGARLYTTRRDRTGTRHRAKEWISVLQLAGHGGWAVYTTAGGEPAIVAVPATSQLLAGKLSELNRSLP